MALCAPLLYAEDSPVAPLRQTSPDGKWVVKGTRLEDGLEKYAIINKTTSKDLSVTSSYQKGEGEFTDSWARTHAGKAVLYWSPDSRYLVIDEDNYRCMGTVMLFDLSSGRPVAIPFPAEKIIKKTGLKWKLSRIRIKEDFKWITPAALSFHMFGEVYGKKKGEFEHPDFVIETNLNAKNEVVIGKMTKRDGEM